jgi:hypothetical protein
MATNPLLIPTLNQAITDVVNLLNEFADDSLFSEKVRLVFGVDVSSQVFKALIADLPEIEVVGDEVLQGALGAFSAQTGKIYLSQGLVSGDINKLEAILIEEIGHYVDAQINPVDSAGDEGRIFAALVMGESLSGAELAQLKAEDDHGVINVDGQVITIEMANLTGDGNNNNISGTNNDEPGVIIGGAGTDSLTLYGLATGTTVNYIDPNNGSTSGGGSFKEIESFYFRGNNTSGNDNVNASGANYANLYGEAGNDTLIVSFSRTNFQVGEDGKAFVPVTVTRNGDIGEGSVTLSLNDGTATNSQDYNSQTFTVNFNPGERTKTVDIPIISDTVAETSETINLTLSNPTGDLVLGTQKNATLTIIDNDTVWAGFADVVLDYFDSGAGPIPGPYGFIGNGGTTPINLDAALGNDPVSSLVNTVTLPTGSFITLGFIDETIIDGPGNDIFVREDGAAGDRANVFVSSNLIDFTFLGVAQDNITTAFDLSSINYSNSWSYEVQWKANRQIIELTSFL